MGSKTLTVVFNDQKRTFKFGDVYSFQKIQRNATNNITKPIYSYLPKGDNNGTVNLKSKAEYDNLVKFLEKADADGNRIIDSNDIAALNEKRAKEHKDHQPFSPEERREIYYSDVEEVGIYRDNQDNTGFEILF